MSFGSAGGHLHLPLDMRNEVWLDNGMSNTANTTVIGTNTSGQTVRIVEGRRYFTLYVSDRNFGTFATLADATTAARRYCRGAA